MKKWLLFYFCTCYISLLHAQTRDSIIVRPYPAFTVRQLSLPLTLAVLGLASNGNGNEAFKKEVVEERNEMMPKFHTSIDNYLQFAPLVIAYGLDAAGVKSKTDLLNRSAILMKGELLMLGSVYVLKKYTHQLRPDGSTYNSFPSGHTAQAFAAATLLCEEYKDRFHWMPYAAYGLASGVGMLRMANNRHYISDVLLGAGIGILSMKVAYWTHQYKWGKRTQAINLENP
ncbi:phosphatase PAP2 family protein [[Flexibacter] sp. ATCC 35208]|uniref:phosphatase PAP2 family protein n=1 Tax=[Flexibacter] sp. ATCC 35208 TaxID=1936242 RepID=UPI0009CF3C7B|nr:phosphatase PAP2 family protein [[Flexibacter] sp. ATCC 35208]OMP76612.1 phospholipid phosphatase [[Flexibacter] sp. ATCC 35208]